jgi:hypothetical protein
VPLENLERAERERIVLFSEFSPSMPTSLLALLVTLGSILRSRLDLCLRKTDKSWEMQLFERQVGQI